MAEVIPVMVKVAFVAPAIWASEVDSAMNSNRESIAQQRSVPTNASTSLRVLDAKSVDLLFDRRLDARIQLPGRSTTKRETDVARNLGPLPELLGRAIEPAFNSLESMNFRSSPR